MVFPPELPAATGSRRGAKWKILLITFVLLVVIAVVSVPFLYYHITSLDAEIEAMRAEREAIAAEMEAGGLPVTVEAWKALYPPPGPADNGALLYEEAYTAATALPPENDLLVPYAGKREPAAPGDTYPDEALAAMRAHLEANRRAMELADEAASRHRTHFQAYGWVEDEIGARDTAKALEGLLSLRLEMLTADGETTARQTAVGSLHAAVQMLDESPDQIDTLVALRMRGDFVNLIARMLGRTAPEPELMDMIARLEWRIPAEEIYSNAVAHGVEQVETPEESILLLMMDDRRLFFPFPMFFKQRWVERLLEEYWLYDIRLRRDVLALTGQTALEATPTIDALAGAFKSRVASGLALFRVPTRLEPIWTARAYDRMLASAVAIERFHRDTGAFPPSLDRLVPDFMASVPLDPFDGQPVRYRADGNGYLLYCVGENLTDNGGTKYRKRSEQREKGDIVFAVHLGPERR